VEVDLERFGREAELGKICAFLPVGELAALVYYGDVGIGKTVA
jgi:hypothetical protein